MALKKKITVLVVDDSLMFREMIIKLISADPVIELVGTASDAYEAKEKLLAYRPDVMTLDVEMPKMNGIEFLRRIMPEYPIPVVVVSSIKDSVFDALDAGAVDFVAKPDLNNHIGLESMVNELMTKIKIASIAKVGAWKTGPGIQKTLVQESRQFSTPSGRRIIAIGASTGGTEAISTILKSFPPNIPGTLIVQHMPPGFTRMYAERLNNSCMLEIKEAQTGDQVLPGRVLIAPGDHHLVLKKAGDNYLVECYQGDKVNGHCPSIEVLFKSVAELAGRNAIGVILTGMGSDGARSLLQMRHCGAHTIGQDEESSIVYGMPKVAYEIGAVEQQVSLDNIAQTICSLLDE
ncbi:MAG: chemotaxis response regulator protein-glutamate methylesterase [Firmicutes bacterium]|nr:chemotaxis response regulator protein-glutamate methylesterase [Bacillota bacterium]